jgi:hypothetical protein
VLTLIVPLSEELYDEEKEEFVEPVTFTLELEHSLASLSKWESREEKPFLGKDEKTNEQTLAYIRDMVLTPDVPEEVFEKFSPENLTAVNDYISAKMTATWFRELEPTRRGNSSEVITAELIYYWMVSLQIPFEAQYWHLNRLITLVRVCNEKNKPAKKVNRQTAAQRQRELNAQRRAQFGTRG